MALVPSEPRGELERLTYDLSLRTLGQQEAVLGELRSRTGILLTASALVTSFLGARALQDGASPWFGLTGLGAAVTSILFSIYVLAKGETHIPDRCTGCVRILCARGERSRRGAPNPRLLDPGNLETKSGRYRPPRTPLHERLPIPVLTVILWSLGLALD
jgi:hypothetical protein